jgi:hypothetical protein
MPVLEAAIEAIDGRVMTGWITSPVRTSIEFFSGGGLLGSTLPDAHDDGRMRFEFLLPQSMFDGREHAFVARVNGVAIALRNNAHVLALSGQAIAEAPLAEAPLEVTGHLDIVSEKGGIAGWARYPDRPDARVEIEILVDGESIGSVTANRPRPDLAEVGFGDGTYGFFMPLPYQALTQSRDVIVVARDQRSGEIIPKPWAFRQKAVADALVKIEALESDLRLLSSTIAELERRAGQDERAASELFKTVGRFFMELGNGGAAARTQILAAPVEDAAPTLPPLAFPEAATPDISIFVQAAGDAAAIHDVLHAVAETLGNAKAEVFLLDHGDCADAPLLPAMVGNLHYARLPGISATARCNDAMRLAGGRIVMFLGGGVHPIAGWPQALAMFDARPNLAALAARLSGPGSTRGSGGITLHQGDMLARVQGLEAPAPVDAVAPAAFAVRRATWDLLGGLDEGFTGAGPALAEFCLRAKAAGHRVGYEPGFAAILTIEADAADITREAQDALRLREIAASFRQAAE